MRPTFRPSSHTRAAAVRPPDREANQFALISQTTMGATRPLRAKRRFRHTEKWSRLPSLQQTHKTPLSAQAIALGQFTATDIYLGRLCVRQIVLEFFERHFG